MNFDATIGLGEVIAIVTILGSLWKFHRQNTKRIYQIEFKVGLMWKHFAHRFNLPEKLEDADESQ